MLIEINHETCKDIKTHQLALIGIDNAARQE